LLITRKKERYDNFSKKLTLAILYISHNPFHDATCQECNTASKEKMSNMETIAKEKVDKAKAST
jgi:hypothetical protein